MPFKTKAAKERVNRLVWSFNGQKLVLHYNAGEKFAQLEEKVDQDGLDRLDENGQAEDLAISKIRRQIADLLVLVLEDWDVVDDDEKPIPLNPKAIAAINLPLEFFTGLSTAIQDDFQQRGEGTKSRS